MDAPLPLERLFKEKLLRIPDYQRGYAWQAEQLEQFWEDLVTLQDERSHYTGVLTLNKVSASAVPRGSNEFWLVDDHSYSLYNVVDGQQRLTTFVIFVQAFADFLKSHADNKGKAPCDIYVTDSFTLRDLEERYLYKINPKGDYRTYKFSYTEDDPSQDYLRHRVLGEKGSGQLQETFYTLNLGNAKEFFAGQIAEWHQSKGAVGVADLFKRLTKRMLFNEYVIDESFDVFVTFETMNNRGKKLSDLELLKNRLIYLTTLYSADRVDEGGRAELRSNVNLAWKEVYHQLGRNKSKPLNDDDFLRAHWISYFKYSRDTGRDFARFLLEEHFIAKSVHGKIAGEVVLESIEEQSDDLELEDSEISSSESSESAQADFSGRLSPKDIQHFVSSLRESAGHWFSSFYPDLVVGMSEAQQKALDRLNRIGMGYFRPLIMVALKVVPEEHLRLQLFEQIERFIFIAFRMGGAKSNFRSSEFYNLARSLGHREVTVDKICERMNAALKSSFNADGTLRIDDFYNLLFKKFGDGSGYYGWSGLRYFLYEYEDYLLSKSRQAKVDWTSLLKSGSDRISIEHVYPQTPTHDWVAAFAELSDEDRARYAATLGNLLLLSASINSSLQNDSFASKKSPKIDASGRKLRNGYSDGSHSEIEVANNERWGPSEIRERSLKLVGFMEHRWKFDFREEDRRRLTFVHQYPASATSDSALESTA